MRLRDEVYKVPTTILHRWGILQGLVLSQAIDRAGKSLGAFTLSAGDVAATWGVSERQAKRSLASLEAGEAIQRVADPRTGQRTHWQLGPATGDKMSPVFSASLKRLFKGSDFLSPVDEGELRRHLAAFEVGETEADLLLAKFPRAYRWWIAAKVRECQAKDIRADRRHAYLQAALGSWQQPGEVERAARRLRLAAKAARSAADAAEAERVGRRAEALQQAHTAALDARALAWWRTMAPEQQAALRAEYLAQVDDCVRDLEIFTTFDPESNPPARAALVEAWFAALVPLARARITQGVDVQGDGRLPWVRLACIADCRLPIADCQKGPEEPEPEAEPGTGAQALPAVWLVGWGEPVDAERVPVAGVAAGLVDEADGNTTAFAHSLATTWGLDHWATWKGGAEPHTAAGLELRRVAPASPAEQVRRWWGNERAHAAAALALLVDTERLGVAPALLGDATLWRQLAGRVELDPAKGDQERHAFDGLKMALAAGGQGV